jgi:hypothetical protein
MIQASKASFKLNKEDRQPLVKAELLRIRGGNSTATVNSVKADIFLTLKVVALHSML